MTNLEENIDILLDTVDLQIHRDKTNIWSAISGRIYQISYRQNDLVFDQCHSQV